MFDVHCGHKDCDLLAFKKFMAESDDKTYFIGGGDLIDAIIAKDIRRYRKSDDATKGDAVIDEQLDIIYDILKPYSKRIIGLAAGNHEDSILKYCGTDPTSRLCKMLSDDTYTVKYLGYSCLVKLIFHENNGRGRSVVIREHHGWGGGSRTRGADITKYEKDMGKWDADIYLYGHVHKKQTDKMPRLGMAGKTLIAKPQLLCICGTFEKTYSNTTDPTYAETKGFPPTEIGGVTINIKPLSHGWVDLSAVT